MTDLYNVDDVPQDKESYGPGWVVFATVQRPASLGNGIAAASVKCRPESPFRNDAMVMVSNTPKQEVTPEEDKQCGWSFMLTWLKYGDRVKILIKEPSSKDPKNFFANLLPYSDQHPDLRLILQQRQAEHQQQLANEQAVVQTTLVIPPVFSGKTKSITAEVPIEVHAYFMADAKRVRMAFCSSTGYISRLLTKVYLAGYHHELD